MYICEVAALLFAAALHLELVGAPYLFRIIKVLCRVKLFAAELLLLCASAAAKLVCYQSAALSHCTKLSVSQFDIVQDLSC